jgi:hypothetical protein
LSSGEPVTGRKSEGSRFKYVIHRRKGQRVRTLRVYCDGGRNPGPARGDLAAETCNVRPPRARKYRRALDLYAWNVNAATALYPVLHMNEVALRNAVDRALASQFGVQWPYSSGFLRTLPRFERQAFEGTRVRLERSLKVARVSTGDVVAAQTYGFWVLLLTSRYQGRIWQQEFTQSFPSAPPRVDRSVVHDRADEIRRLRNRIAHHEPMFNYDLLGAHQRAASMVRWISPVLLQWTLARWPVNREFLKRP